MNRLMKYRFALFSLLALMVACKQQSANQDPRQQILEKHDALMVTSEQAMSIKMRLDTLKLNNLPSGRPISDTIMDRKEITKVQHYLTKADNDMEDWMHNYQPEFKGSSTDETNAYFKKEAVKLNKLSSDFEQAITASNNLFARLHVKNTPTTIKK
ncbi:hypothetical protein SNE25_20630 [Mucilaginibacter sabulilitoris]|uniref:Viral A-type inclusion protein n=1 Tax=Mucilaginibacter sabulilitoris TaxID=1173583 RepID=A0ABZ0THM0_9SPHI|nr:hypothetical protein [Mucilaginibacter sabulilitoris]WPU91728.1 hypothetical protein SNE25_20630 [Mucilaginibacter sabulilitoris]